MGDQSKGIWAELRRRRVVSSAAAYAAVAFVLLQLAEIVFPAFGFDQQAMRVLVAIILAGFPIVLAFSWVFDVTREGLKMTRPQGNEGSEGSTAAPAPSFVVVGLVVICAVGLGWGGWHVVRGGDAVVAATPQGASIAVLPFSDMSESGDQAYLGDGIAEEILNVLAGVQGLRVAARTSSFAFRDATEDVRDIGQQLGVETLLEGSVRRDSLRVRVTAQLIDTQSGFHLWSGTFDQEMKDLFAVQDTIAGAIAQELLGRLDITPSRHAEHVVDEAAWTAYQKGRTEWNRRGPTAIPAAIGYFEEALSIDPQYAEAMAGLADSYALLPQTVASADPADSWARAEEWALKAIELDPALAEAHASLGLVRALMGDRGGALASLGDAIRLNASYAPALHWRANVLAEMGQLDPARADAARAAELDPLSAPILTDLGNILLWSGNPIGAGSAFDRAVDQNFNYAAAHFGTALVALDEGEEVSFHMALAQWAAEFRHAGVLVRPRRSAQRDGGLARAVLGGRVVGRSVSRGELRLPAFPRGRGLQGDSRLHRRIVDAASADVCPRPRHLGGCRRPGGAAIFGPCKRAPACSSGDGGSRWLCSCSPAVPLAPSSDLSIPWTSVCSETPLGRWRWVEACSWVSVPPSPGPAALSWRSATHVSCGAWAVWRWSSRARFCACTRMTRSMTIRWAAPVPRTGADVWTRVTPG
jgi:TolB-like protein/Tfp pilus assembly protein PilF